MSWRKFDTYNRGEHNEEFWRKLDLYVEEAYDEPHDWWWDNDWHPWGTIYSMEEYHQMKVVTLLHKLFLRTAKDTTDYKGW